MARGDRSLREYAKDTDINVSILSRIERGEYKPGKKVLKKLTSPDAKPQGGVTYQDLVEAANDNELYRKGIAAGMAVAGLVPGALPGITAALLTLASSSTTIKAQILLQEKERSKTKGSKQGVGKSDISRYGVLNQEIQRFAATATGIIYGKLASKGVRFRIGMQEETDITLYDGDSLLLVENQCIDSWMLSFIAMSEEDRGMDKIVKNSAKSMFERLLFIAPDAKRKYSIVVNDKVLFDYLLEYKDKNSYRGNLSIIEIDVKNVEVVREEYISFYDLDKVDEKLKITENGGNEDE